MLLGFDESSSTWLQVKTRPGQSFNGFGGDMFEENKWQNKIENK